MERKLYVEQDPAGMPPMGGDPTGGLGGGMGGSMPPMGGPGPGMGGGLDSLGGGGGLPGMTPPGGDMGQQQKPPMKIKPADVWNVFERILKGKKVDSKKDKEIPPPPPVPPAPEAGLPGQEDLGGEEGNPGEIPPPPMQ